MTTNKIAIKSMDLFQTSPKKTDNRTIGKDSFQNIMDKQPTNKSDTRVEVNKKDTNDLKSNTITSYDESKVTSKEDALAKTSHDEDQLLEGENTLTGEDDLTKEEIIKKLEEIVSVMQQILMGQLNLTKEELDTVMKNLSLNTVDSLNMEQLKLIALEANGLEDLSIFLTDENLLESVQNLHEDLQALDLLGELNITDEELSGLVKQLDNTSLARDQDMSSLIDESSATSNHGFQIEVVKEDSTALNLADFKEAKDEDVKSNDNKDVLNQVAPNLAFNEVASTEFSNGIDALNQIREIVNQVVEQIKLHIKPEQTSMEIQLNPENLGRIQLSVVEKDGVLTASFKALNEVAKEALESQIHVLKDNLNNQGLKVEAIEVTVSNFMFEQNGEAATSQQNNQNTNKQFFFRSDDEITKIEKDDLMAEVMEQSGSSVNYTA